jgi:nicotinate-nucleotide adenylyltransferase
VSGAERMRPIGIFGGTFDPIHYGHLRTALELQQTLELERIHFVPSAQTPQKSGPIIDGRLRMRLVEAALENEPQFVADARELEREGPSYTIDTLASFRKEFPRRPLCLLVGMDAFLGLPTWHRWDELLDFAHLVVAHRPGWRAPDTGFLGDLLRARRTQNPAELHAGPAGCVHVQPVTQLEISSTDLRASIAAGLDPKFLMPDNVRRIILETECYAETP